MQPKIVNQTGLSQCSPIAFLHASSSAALRQSDQSFIAVTPAPKDVSTHYETWFDIHDSGSCLTQWSNEVYQVFSRIAWRQDWDSLPSSVFGHRAVGPRLLLTWVATTMQQYTVCHRHTNILHSYFWNHPRFSRIDSWRLIVQVVIQNTCILAQCVIQ